MLVEMLGVTLDVTLAVEESLVCFEANVELEGDTCSCTVSGWAFFVVEV